MNPEHYFKLADGRALKSLAELLSALGGMKDEIFRQHITDSKNDFANWIRDVLKEPALASGIRHVRTRSELSHAIDRFLKKGYFTYETIIIGGGIGGIGAAIYAARERINYVLITLDIGGQMNVSGEVENYPGIVHTTGTEFIKIIQDQARYNELEIKNETAKKILLEKNNNFIVETDKGKYETETVVIASGASHKKLNIPGEAKYSGKGVSYCAICDGPLYRHKTVAIIGGGDSALEDARFLSRIADKIYLITTNPEMKGHEYLQERVLSNERVNLVANAKTIDIYGDRFVKGIRIEQNNRKKEIPCDGIFVAIGMEPNTSFAKGLVKLDADGHIVVDKYMQTSVAGIFAGGDCADVHEYQYVTAAGQAVTALLRASEYLRKKQPEQNK